jgi:hypothetical protein
MQRLSFLRSGSALGVLVLALGCAQEREKPSGEGVIDPVCGPCGSLELGDVSFAGNVRVDGLFLALVEIDRAERSISRDFERYLDTLMLEFGASVAKPASLDDKVKALLTSVRSEVDANAGAPLTVEYVAANCAEDVVVAVEAQLQCELRDDCEPVDGTDPRTVGAACDGTCEGGCSGPCSESCLGRCMGGVVPPTISPGCETGMLCQRQAGARAAGGLTCDPASVAFTWDASTDPPFDAKVALLRRYGTRMLEDGARLSALVRGRVDDEVVFARSPLALLVDLLDEDVALGVENELLREVPVGRVNCTLDAYEQGLELVDELGQRAALTLSAQTTFRTALVGGFAD